MILLPHYNLHLLCVSFEEKHFVQIAVICLFALPGSDGKSS